MNGDLICCSVSKTQGNLILSRAYGQETRKKERRKDRKKESKNERPSCTLQYSWDFTRTEWAILVFRFSRNERVTVSMNSRDTVKDGKNQTAAGSETNLASGQTLPCQYGVATSSRFPKNVGLFCKRALRKRPVFRKRDLHFKGGA